VDVAFHAREAGWDERVEASEKAIRAVGGRSVDVEARSCRLYGRQKELISRELAKAL
jgi:hypothetical protein